MRSRKPKLPWYVFGNARHTVQPSIREPESLRPSAISSPLDHPAALPCSTEDNMAAGCQGLRCSTPKLQRDTALEKRDAGDTGEQHSTAVKAANLQATVEYIFSTAQITLLLPPHMYTRAGCPQQEICACNVRRKPNSETTSPLCERAAPSPVKNYRNGTTAGGEQGIQGP